MGIINIEFTNVRSLGNAYVDLSTLNVLIGKNGAGKTNIQKYLYYFYENLLDKRIDSEVLDKNNPYNNYAQISVTYDLKRFIDIGDKVENKDNEFFLLINNLTGEKDSKITLTMKQNKNSDIVWNHDYYTRKLIKYLFPIYYLDIRSIDVYNWEDIWGIIGDLGQRRSKNESNLEHELKSMLKGIYGGKYIEYIDNLDKKISDLGYNVVSYKNSEKFEQIIKVKFGGEQFNFREKKLEYYSKGSNSYNYVMMFYSVLEIFSDSKIKSPIIILDEPEIGLHPTLIDKLIKYIYSIDKSIQSIISSHSPRLLKNVLINKDVNIFQVLEKNSQSFIRKVRNLENLRSKYVISDKEASYYFSDGILFVEGVTEYELFNNDNIRKIYKLLQNIEVFSYNSNNISLDASFPIHRNLDIPYILLVDMDKIMKYSESDKKFQISGDTFNPLKDSEIIYREKLMYGENRILSYYRSRIKGITSKVKFNYDPDYFIFDDKLFHTLRNLIKTYNKNYNVYPVNTTIEGVIINNHSYTLFYDWLINVSNYNDKEDLKKIYKTNTSTSYKVNVLKTIVEGNLEPLFKITDERIENCLIDDIATGYKQVLKLEKLKKGSGWISEFIDYSYDKYKNDDIKKKFNELFPELADIIKTLQIIME